MARTWIVSGMLAVWLATGLAARAQEEYSGAFYVGDANGNGIIEPGDISQCQLQYAGGAALYSGVVPAVWDVQELNGNGAIDPPDYAILQNRYVGNFSTGDAGKPARLEPVSTTINIIPGDSTVICAELTDLAGVGDPNTTDRAGWGVNFAVDPGAGNCPTTLLYGRNPWPIGGGGKDQYVYAQKVFEYTDRLTPNGSGKACVRVLPPLTGCEGMNVVVNAYVPSDLEALCNGNPGLCFGTVGRFPTRLDATDSFTGFMVGPPAITIAPDPAAVNDGAAVQLTATDDTLVDVTESATWSVVSGPCSVSDAPGTKGLVSAAEGCSNQVCVVQADYDSMSDTATVTVTNDETEVVGIDVTPEGPLVSRGSMIDFNCEAFYADMCSLSCDVLAGWTIERGTGCDGEINFMGMYFPWDHSSGCTETITGTYAGLSDSETVTIPVSANYYDDDLAFGPFGGSSSGFDFSDGHTVELEIANACTQIAPGDLDCWVRIINRDSDEYMANTFLNFYDFNCDGDLNNADLLNGDTIHGVMADGNAGTPAPLDGAGLCIVEDGASYENALHLPYNIYGAQTHPVPQGSAKPIQELHPKAGQISYLWQLRGLNGGLSCGLGATLSADWFPWNPVGPDGIPGNEIQFPGSSADDDPRYDFQNYTTVYLILADFASRAGASTLYGRGSYQRSNVLAGYGAPGMRSGYTVTANSYFSVNVAIEYPDRIESQVMGDPFHFDAVNGYEYYGTYAVFFRWDPAVLDVVNVAKSTQGIWNTARTPCYVPNNCTTDARESYQHLDTFDISTMGQINRTNGYIYFYRQMAFSRNFDYYSTYLNYLTDMGAQILLRPNLAYTQFVNAEGGHKGVAKFNHAYAGSTLFGDNTNFRVQDGVDAAPEQNLLNFHFWVRPGTSGKSSALMVDNFAGYTGFILSHTGTTFYPSGRTAPTDWHAYCSPFSPGFANSTDQHCDPSKLQSDYAVYHGRENVNPMIGQSGEALYGGTGTSGAVQQWPVYIVVQ